MEKRFKKEIIDVFFDDMIIFSYYLIKRDLLNQIVKIHSIIYKNK